MIRAVPSKSGPAPGPIERGTFLATLIGAYPPLGATSCRTVRGGGCGGPVRPVVCAMFQLAFGSVGGGWREWNATKAVVRCNHGRNLSKPALW